MCSVKNSNDTIIFMSAYKATKYSKSRNLFKKTVEILTLLRRYHITWLLDNDEFVSRQGRLKLHTEYDYVKQNTKFSFLPMDENENIKEYEDIINHAGFCIKLLHAQSVLSDTSYFKINLSILMESFNVYIGKKIFQVDPFVFLLNGMMIIVFEVIDCETGCLLQKENVFGKRGNYNLLSVNGYQFFDDESVTYCNMRIPEIIYKNISSFFAESKYRRYIPDQYSFVHSTLVLLNDIDNIADYLCSLLGVNELGTQPVNISTTNQYQYYPRDGAGVITQYSAEDIDAALYNGILLEAIKLYIYLQQIINMDIADKRNKVIKNDLYLESLFFAPNVPIETSNLLQYIYSTASFRHHKEAIKLKLSYMAQKNESSKNRNGVILNALLYFISVISLIGTLDVLEDRMNIPFCYSFAIVLFLSSVLGILWLVIEWRRNERF